MSYPHSHKLISFIVPAHNEEHFLGATLAAIEKTSQRLNVAYEIIVAADACTDATESIARAYPARVVSVTHRQISATRNSGAKVATGDLFFFIDADTLANADAVSECLSAAEQGAVGGGCVFRFDQPVPWWAHAMYVPSVAIGRRVKLVGGCFLFCTRQAFERVGGFDETVFAAEEIFFLKALKRVGSVVIPRPTVVTSGRKMPLATPFDIIRLLALIAMRGPKGFQSRKGLDLHYGAKNDKSREDAPRSLTT
jgi:glycosyltransferase involved in cell wall biosynthesis